MRKRRSAFFLAIAVNLGGAGCHHTPQQPLPQAAQKALQISVSENCLRAAMQAAKRDLAAASDLPKPESISVVGTRLTVHTQGDTATSTVDLADDDQIISYRGKTYGSWADQNAWLSGRFIDLPKPEQTARGIVNLLSKRCPQRRQL